jgi:hypothetical protein
MSVGRESKKEKEEVWKRKVILEKRDECEKRRERMAGWAGEV